MAGDWIPYTVDLPRKPEVLAISGMTGMPVREVVGTLMEFWAWADAQSEDGVFESSCPQNVRIASGQDADECPQNVRILSASCPHVKRTFWEAMAKVGWLEVAEDGFRIPKFDRWMSSRTKRRLLDTKRKRRSRASEGAPADSPVRKMSASQADKTRTNCGQKADPLSSPSSPSFSPPVNPPLILPLTPPPSPHEEPPPNPPAGGTPPFDPLKVDLPGALDTPRFREAWSLFVAHRREIKKKLTPTAVRQSLKELASWGEAEAVRALEHTVARGWQGIRRPDGTPPSAAGKSRLERLKERLGE